MPNKFTTKMKGMFQSPSLEEELINLKMTSKQMQRASKKCEKNEKAAVTKVKKVRLPLDLRGGPLQRCLRPHVYLQQHRRPLRRGTRKELEYTPKMQYEKKIR